MASQRQIAANKRNGAKSRGPFSQEGKARSRMNALRHGLAAATIAPAGGHASASDSCMNARYQRLRQIDIERVKVLNEVHNLSRSEDLDMLHTVFDGSRRSNATRSAPIQSWRSIFFEPSNEMTFLPRNMLPPASGLGCLESKGLVQKIGQIGRTNPNKIS